MNKLIFAIICIACLSSNPVLSQKLEPQAINGGFDPSVQGFYLGFDHQTKNYSIGIDVGSSFGIMLPATYCSVTLDNNKYFGGYNKYGRKTFYLNGRLCFAKIFDMDSNKPFRVSLIPGIGNNFTLSEHWCLNIGVGVQIPLYITNGNASYSLGPYGKNTYTYYEFTKALTPSLRIELKHR